MRSELKNYLVTPAFPMIGNLKPGNSKLETLIAAYKKSRPQATPSDVYFALTTDLEFRGPAIKQAELKAAQGAASAYMYQFAWPLPALGGKLRAGHFAECAVCVRESGESRPLGWHWRRSSAPCGQDE